MVSWRMLRRPLPCLPLFVLVWLLPLPPAAASLRPPVKMAIEQAQSSVPLGAWERGHLAMYLEQNGFGCMLASKQTPKGSLALRIETAAGQPNRITIVNDKGLRPRAFGACLKRMLRRVNFQSLAQELKWDGTLRYDPDNFIEVGVTSLYGQMLELTMEHVVRAALDPAAPCLAPFFHAEPKLSAVLLAQFDVDPTGAPQRVQTTASTVAQPELLTCVSEQLGAIRFPAGALTGARLRLSLLRVQRGPVPDDGTPTLMMQPPPRGAR